MLTLQKAFDAHCKKAANPELMLDAINKFALEPVTAEEVFVGRMALANDQYDRSHERFTPAILHRFADTMEGRPVLTGHDKSSVPVGKFLGGDVVKQQDGSHVLYTDFYLKAGDPLTDRVRLGIASGVSIGFKAAARTCDLCSKDYDSGSKTDRCQHQQGREYDGKRCTVTYSGDLSRYEALEGSFVAFPCQFGAQTVGQRSDGSTYTVKMAIVGGGVVTEFDQPEAPAKGDQMELEQALARIKELEAQVAAAEPLVEAGKSFRETLLAEIARKYTSIKAEKTGLAITKSLANADISSLKDADKDAQELFDKEFPPKTTAHAGLGGTTIADPEPKRIARRD